ncbi:MAG: hypothetical protein ACOCVF_04105 [bacterium]
MNKLTTYKDICFVNSGYSKQNFYKCFNNSDDSYNNKIVAIIVTVRDDFKEKPMFHVYNTFNSREIRPKIIYKDKNGAYIKVKRDGETHKQYLSKELLEDIDMFIKMYLER